MTADPTRIALVHEWLSSRAGSEKTFEQMAKAFPSADLYALTVEPRAKFDFDRHIRTTLLQRSSFLSDRRNLSLPLMPAAWKMLKADNYDVVVTSSHAFSRYFPSRGATHLSYVYSPLRYAWLPGVDRRASSRWLSPARSALRSLDHRTVGRVRNFAGISHVVADRIRSYYGREAAVIYPPVDIDFFRSGPPVDREGFVLGVSRWIPYKKLDLVIEAAEIAGMPAVIAGAGPMEPELRRLSRGCSVPVTLVREPTNEQLLTLYKAASVLVFPAEEDFGIVPVEAQAAGTPVVALARGGSLDTVVDGLSGALVEEQNPSAFASGIRRALSIDMTGATEHVDQFSEQTFREAFTRWVNESLG